MTRIQNLENLFFVGARVLDDFIARERLAGDVLPGRISDHAGEIADQEDAFVPEFLKLAQLVEQDGVPQMQVGRGGIESRLHAQRSPGAQPLRQLALQENLLRTALDFSQCLSDRAHSTPLTA
jgi:hypothetical protein